MGGIMVLQRSLFAFIIFAFSFASAIDDFTVGAGIGLPRADFVPINIHVSSPIAQLTTDAYRLIPIVRLDGTYAAGTSLAPSASLSFILANRFILNQQSFPYLDFLIGGGLGLGAAEEPLESPFLTYHGQLGMRVPVYDDFAIALDASVSFPTANEAIVSSALFGVLLALEYRIDTGFNRGDYE
jgi:hypothetical protein